MNFSFFTLWFCLSTILTDSCSITVPQHNPDIFLEYGSVASNTKLCKSIGWNDKAREEIATAHKKCLEENSKLNLKDVQSLQLRKDIIERHYKSIAHLCNDVTKRHVINGLFASQGVFAFANKVVVEDMDLDEHSVRKLNTLLQKGNSQLVAIYTSKIAIGKFVTYREFVDLFGEVVLQYEKEFINMLKEEMPHVVTKVEDYMKYTRNSKYDEKYMNIRSSLLLKVQMEYAGKGIRFDRQPLLLNMTLLVMINVPEGKELIRLSEQEAASVANLYSQFITRYHEIVELYNQIETNDSQIIASALSFHRRVMVDEFNRYDMLLAEKVPDKIVRIQAIHRQFSGINGLFNISTMGKRYKLTSDQRKKYTEINKRLYQLAPQTKLSHEARAKRLFTKEQELYNKVFTDEQRQQWDNEVGDKISEESFIKLYVQFNELSDKYERQGRK